MEKKAFISSTFFPNSLESSRAEDPRDPGARTRSDVYGARGSAFLDDLRRVVDAPVNRWPVWEFGDAFSAPSTNGPHYKSEEPLLYEAFGRAFVQPYHHWYHQPPPHRAGFSASARSPIVEQALESVRIDRRLRPAMRRVPRTSSAPATRSPSHRRPRRDLRFTPPSALGSTEFSLEPPSSGFSATSTPLRVSGDVSPGDRASCPVLP